MVHRDIKPSNLIRTVSGKQHVVKILDFGLAKLTSETGSESGQTKTGQVLGTPDYIAPEQIRKAKSADIRADIYALGGTLYFLLTGRPPFQADNLYDLFRQHHEASPVPVHEVRSDAPPALSDVIGRMMAKDPAARYQTPKEVATALEPFVKSGTSSGKARETVVDPTEDDKLAAIYAAKTIAPVPEKAGAARPSQKVATIFTQKTEYKSPERRQQMLPGLEIGDLNVAQRADFRQMRLQDLHALLAISSATVVFARSQFVPDHAVAHHQLKVMRHRQQLILEGAAIEHQGMPSGAINGDELVHDPAACAHEFVFRPLTQFHQFQTGNINSGKRAQGKRSRDFTRAAAPKRQRTSDFGALS